MRREQYKEVLARGSVLHTGEREVSRDDVARWRVVINRWAQRIWERYFFPEWTNCEERRFRPVWDEATQYDRLTTGPVEVWDPVNEAYFQLVGPLGLGAFNGPHNNEFLWAECQSSYTGDLWTETQGTVTVGTIQRYGPTDEFYYCHTEHTASATLTPVATLGDERWGRLWRFVRVIDFDGGNQEEATVMHRVKAVWDDNPRVNASAGRIEFDEIEDGVIVRGTESKVWVEFMRRPPSWLGEDWDEDTTYGEGDVVYSTEEGDWYRSLEDTNTDEVTEDSWERVDFPWVLRECAAQGGYADMIRGTEPPAVVAEEERQAWKMAGEEFERAEKGQGRERQLNVLVR